MKYRFGTDYYPEHWPRERWATDARMMREMGISIVRMAEFSWSKWEPAEGEFHFEDLDEVIDILAREGIDCILGTPTAAPPAWIIRKDPDIQPVDVHGHRRFFGGRHHDCQSNPAYREHIRRFVTAFARHYAGNPHVVGWQVDNELGNSHSDLCFCPHCEKRFRSWLQEKYGTVEKLNACWGTAFWSQDLASFDEVTAPRDTVTGHNPSQELDWKRFCSDLVLDFHAFQAEILRREAPGKFITHNMMGFSDKVDYFKLSEQLDFASQDQYPVGHWTDDPRGYHAPHQAADLDLIRSAAHKPFWVMEQQSGITGWETLGRTPRPGQLALWAMQSIAHGADTVVFFRWRTCTMGTEQYWHGILPHNGVPGRNYRELKALMSESSPVLDRVQGSVFQKEAAILHSYDQAYAMTIQPHSPGLEYRGHLMRYYCALHRRNVPVDFVREQDDWSGYKMVIAPFQFLMTPELSEKMHAYTERGGTLVLDFRCGVKDATNRVIADDALPCLVNDLCGLKVTDYDCLGEDRGLVRWGDQTYPTEMWNDLIEADPAEPLAVYDSEFYSGTPAITVNRYGKGRVYYIGTGMTEALADRMVTEWLDHDLIQPVLDAPAGVEVTCRQRDGESYYFVLNHLAEECRVPVPEAWQPLDGKEKGNAIPGYGFRVYMHKREC